MHSNLQYFPTGLVSQIQLIFGHVAWYVRLIQIIRCGEILDIVCNKNNMDENQQVQILSQERIFSPSVVPGATNMVFAVVFVSCSKFTENCY